MAKTTEYKRRVRLRLYAAQRGKCCYCERLIYIKGHDSEASFPIRTKRGAARADYAATFEHLHRRADGGRSNIGNLALACVECNSKRGSTDWLTYKSFVMGELEIAA